VTTVVVTQTQVGCIALGANADKMVGFGIELGLRDFFALVGLSIRSSKFGRIWVCAVPLELEREAALICPLSALDRKGLKRIPS